MKKEDTTNPASDDPFALPAPLDHRHEKSDPKIVEAKPVPSKKAKSVDEAVDDLIQRILTHRTTTNKAIWQTGRMLLELEAVLKGRRCKYGNWGNVIRNELGLTYQTAGRYKLYARVAEEAERRDKIDIMLKLDPTVVYLAAARSAPKAALEQVLRRAAEKDKVTVEETKTIVRQAKRAEASKKSGSDQTDQSDDNSDPFEATWVAFKAFHKLYKAADKPIRKEVLKRIREVYPVFVRNLSPSS